MLGIEKCCQHCKPHEKTHKYKAGCSDRSRGSIFACEQKTQEGDNYSREIEEDMVMHQIMDQNPAGIVGKWNRVLYKAVQKTYQKCGKKSQDTA